MRSEMRASLVALMLTCATLGCGRRPEPVAVAPEPAAPAANDGAERAAAERAARAAAEAAEAARREAERVRAVLEARVFFDYDQSEIRTDARRTLDDKVRVLRDAPAIRLRVEGHADERGSTEYNLALGARRASSIVTYLTGFGLPASRFETVSFGEERPLEQGSSERAWSRNRRAEFVIVGGAPTD